ncbi:hypothetical protein [Streptomyces venetus]|uniref:hypothetical protein n=1 Tax=Streptomyces venetus TaxID=1701086 RepID=UPI0031E7EF20
MWTTGASESAASPRTPVSGSPGASTGSGNRGDGGGGNRDGDGDGEVPSEKFSWLRIGPKSPEFDALQPDHVYDLIQRHNCDRAQRQYDVKGSERRAEAPATWNLLKGLIGICFAVQGNEGGWKTAIESYREVRGITTGDCKYQAGYDLLKQVGSFLLEHPDGKVEFGEAPTGPGAAACPYRVTDLYFPIGNVDEAAPGDIVEVHGTWPSEVRHVFLDGKKQDVRPLSEGDEDKACCHKGITLFEVPQNLQPGTEVKKITLAGDGFELTAPRGFTVKAP